MSLKNQASRFSGSTDKRAKLCKERVDRANKILLNLQEAGKNETDNVKLIALIEQTISLCQSEIVFFLSFIPLVAIDKDWPFTDFQITCLDVADNFESLKNEMEIMLANIKIIQP